jgi:dCTP deaminase
MVQHRQRVCRITFERLVEPADKLYGDSIGSNYQGQQSTLSKYFRRPPPTRQLALI